MLKYCKKCDTNKALEDFTNNINFKDGKWAYCRTCVSLIGKDYYKKTPSKKLKIKERIENNYKKIIELKSVPCADCNIQYHYCAMEFDHLPGFKKEFNIGSGLRKYGLEKVLKEVKKCEVVCSNCHHVRTFNRSTNWS